MKVRLVSKKELKKAYEKEPVKNNKIDLKEEVDLDSVDKVPNELFLILSETLSFIEEANNKEERK